MIEVLVCIFGSLIIAASSHSLMPQTSGIIVDHRCLCSQLTQLQSGLLQEPPLERRGVGEKAGRKRLRVSAASLLRLLARLPDLRLFFLAQLDLQGANILLNPGNGSGTRDGEEVVSLGQDPSQSQLTGSAVLLLRNLGDAIDELEVLGEVLGGEARRELAEIALLEVVGAADLTAKHASADR